ncbi:MAG: class I SAM-dependent methyltransferase [Bacteroidota bacterium]
MTSTFPLYKNDSKPSIPLNSEQLNYIGIVKSKIDDGSYKLVTVPCLCGGDGVKDITLTQKDRYGFAIGSKLCAHCGLIRSEQIFDEASTISFYTHEYRKIYQPDEEGVEALFADQTRRGEVFYKLFQREIGDLAGATVFEIGCGAGGILYPFHKAGYIAEGIDYDRAHLEYGKLKGMNLQFGNYKEAIPAGSKDIMILSHVLEHMSNPVRELNDIFEKLKDNGYLILEVPGIFCIHNMYFDPITYFQNAHVYSFYKDYLIKIAMQIGVNVKYANERVTLILQKPVGWKRNETLNLIDPSLEAKAGEIKKYVYNNYVQNKFKINRYYWKYLFFKTLRNLQLIK